MNDPLKITSSHLARAAIVYLRQSSATQVEHNRESTDRQYALVNKASTSDGRPAMSSSSTKISESQGQAAWRDPVSPG
jgi:hypothetical protein